MNKDTMLHILRNPYGQKKDHIKQARHLAALLIENMEICPKCGCDIITFLSQQNSHEWQSIKGCMQGHEETKP